MKHRILILSLAAASALLAADPATGTWKIEGDVAGNPVIETCTLKQDGAKVTGSCTTAKGAFPLTSGDVDGGKIKFQHGGEYEGTTLVITFAGTVGADGVLKGSINVQPYDAMGDFTGKKSQ